MFGGRDKRTMRSLGLSATLVLLWACSPAPDGSAGECEAAADCGETTAPCAGCPALASSLCLEGTCSVREGDAVDVRADVNLHRDVAAQVRSFVHVLASAQTASGPLSCDAAFAGDRRLVEDVNVLAAGYKAVEGGSFHQGVSVGRVPEGEVTLLVLATSDNAGAGEVLATGCLPDLTAAAPTLEAGLVQVAP